MEGRRGDGKGQPLEWEGTQPNEKEAEGQRQSEGEKV
jgi:hypothetical protein